MLLLEFIVYIARSLYVQTFSGQKVVVGYGLAWPLVVKMKMSTKGVKYKI